MMTFGFELNPGVVPLVGPIAPTPQAPGYTTTSPSIVVPYGPAHPTYVVVLLSGSSAGATSPGRLLILDFANPTTPVLVGQTPLDTTRDPEWEIYFPTDLLINGIYAYVFGELWDFDIYDISDPANPISVAHAATITSQSVAATQLDSTHIATADRGDDRIRTYDISNPLVLTATGSVGSIGGVLDTPVNIISWESGGIWRAACWATGAGAGAGGSFHTISWTSGTGSAPVISDTIVGAANQFTSFGGMVKDGDLVYCANDVITAPTDRSYVTIINVADPTNIFTVGSLLVQGNGTSPRQVQKVGDVLWIMDGAQTMTAIDVSDPTSPKRINRYATTFLTTNTVGVQKPTCRIDVDGVGYFITCGSGRVVAYLIPETPDTYLYLQSSLSTGDNLVGIAATGDSRVVATQTDTDTVFYYDASDPENLSLLDTISGSSFNGVQHIAVDDSGLYAYTVRFGNVMQIIDLMTNYPLLSTPIGGGFGACFGNQLLRDPYDIAYQDDFVYVTCNAGNDVPDGNNGRMTIIDVSDRTTPFLRGTVYDYLLQGGGFSTGNHLTVQDDYVYVCAESTILGGRSFVIIDVSDKDNPVIVGWHTDIGSADIHNVVVEDDYAFVTWGQFFYVYDVSDKTNPQRVASANVGGLRVNGAGLVKVGDWCYFTGSTGDSVAWINVSNPLSIAFDQTHVIVDQTHLDAANQIASDGQYLYVSTTATAGRVTVLNLFEGGGSGGSSGGVGLISFG